MKVILQDVKTELFYKKGQQWTADSDEAMQFASTMNALNHCYAQELKKVQIVLKFDVDQYDIRLPVKPSRVQRRDSSAKIFE